MIKYTSKLFATEQTGEAKCWIDGIKFVIPTFRFRYNWKSRSKYTPHQGKQECKRRYEHIHRQRNV